MFLLNRNALPSHNASQNDDAAIIYVRYQLYYLIRLSYSK